jgi:hypothetical protein
MRKSAELGPEIAAFCAFGKLYKLKSHPKSIFISPVFVIIT